MIDPNHGNSIVTRLRLIIEEMHKSAETREFVGIGFSDEFSNVTDALRAEAENLLPIDIVDDIEVIVLREAAAILNGRGWSDLSEKIENVGDSIAEDYAGR